MPRISEEEIRNIELKRIKDWIEARRKPQSEIDHDDPNEEKPIDAISKKRVNINNVRIDGDASDFSIRVIDDGDESADEDEIKVTEPLSTTERIKELMKSKLANQEPEGFISWPEHAQNQWRNEMELLGRHSKEDKQGLQIRRYLDWLEKVPWKSESLSEIDLKIARKCLDENHYGLNDIKQTILEHIAVQKLNGKNSGTVLLLVGPPGVGKTSLAKSIANALGRKFGKIAMGGMNDEIVLKGADRTYINSFPGVIMRTICACGSRSPLILFDEVDKIPVDSTKSDIVGILIDLLDSNKTAYSDHYIQIPVDLSQVFFICTANEISKIPLPLLDRMDVIKIGGYSSEEKVIITKDYIIPEKLRESGISQFGYQFEQSAVEFVVAETLVNSGVREIERAVGAVCRRIALMHLEEHMEQRNINQNFIIEQKIIRRKARKSCNPIGFRCRENDLEV